MLLFTPTPKCLPFSILYAKSVIIHTSITYNMIKTGVGVNCNELLPNSNVQIEKTFTFSLKYGIIFLSKSHCHDIQKEKETVCKTLLISRFFILSANRFTLRNRSTHKWKAKHKNQRRKNPSPFYEV